MRSPTELKELVRGRAIELGFDDCRVAAAQEPEHYGQFRAWLEADNAGEMDWIGRAAQKRGDPQLVLPGARSVIVLAINYWQGNSLGPNESEGRIARYALGADYHEVLPPKLRQLDDLLTAEGGRQRYYVDTGPVLERDFAGQQRRGLAWQKHDAA